MAKFMKVVVLLVFALCVMTPVFAQSAPADKPSDNMQVLREKIKADKKLLVAANMQLTESEAKGFWPVYEAYQKDLDILTKRTIEMIDSYNKAWNKGSLDNKKAQKLTSDFLALQKDEANHMQAYAAKLSNVLPATKVARYLQIENKIRAILRYEAAYEIPLVPGK